MVTIVTTLIEVTELLAETTIRTRQLEGPQEVSTLLEVRSDSVDLMNQILHSHNSELAQNLLHLLVLHQRNTLLVQLRESTLVHQHTHSLQIRITIGNVRLHQTKHLLSSLVQTHKYSIVDLTQTKKLESLSHLRRSLVNTTNTHNNSQTTLTLSEQMTLIVGLSSLGNQIRLQLQLISFIHKSPEHTPSHTSHCASPSQHAWSYQQPQYQRQASQRQPSTQHHDAASE